jgi:hypothetical protein
MVGDDYTGNYRNSKSLFDVTATDNDNNDNSSKIKSTAAYKLLLKMILSGHVQLYDFNEDIVFDFGQTDIKEYNNVTKITTIPNITIEET